jgi:hypothetical protein
MNGKGEQTGQAPLAIHGEGAPEETQPLAPSHEWEGESDGEVIGRLTLSIHGEGLGER